MRLVTFSDSGGARLGLVRDDGVVDLKKAVPGLPSDMIGLISGWARFADAVEGASGRPADLALEQVKLEAPIARPGKILAIGLNYADHVIESGAETPKQQVWFNKLPTAVNAPFDPVQLPRASTRLDYEAELVVVIGQRCKHVPVEKAHEVVFGYCVGNDVSVRDWQMRTSQWLLGKSFDTHAPFGPWIVTADAIPNPHALGIRAFVNGETRQESNTANLIFNIYDQIACLSQAVTLEPGDLIFTGTPGGIGAAMKPPRFLKAGDVSRIEIDEIGAIEARIIPED